MSIPVRKDLDLEGNEIQNPVAQNLAAAPSSPKAGQFWFDTVDDTLKVKTASHGIMDALSQGDYTFKNGIEMVTNTRDVQIKVATGNNAGNVTITADSNGLAASAPAASTTVAGLIEIATDTEASTGTATTLAVNPKQLATKVTANSAITAATKCKITYDAKGLVTGGANLEASDIPSITLSKISDVTATAAEVNVLDGITASTAELNIMDGVTATASEINVLDGITATTTELNYVHGVTSAVQTQIDNKVTKNANITGGTKCKITYDAKGLVTGGANLAASDIPDISATYVTVASKGVANGVASLDGDGKVPAAQLPSYVDDIIETYIVAGSTALSSGWLSTSASGSALTPETGKIYVILSSGEYLNKTYRWSGSTYVEVSASPAQATESVAGIMAIATDAELTAGTNDTKAVTPKKLATYTSGMAKVTTATNPSLTVSSGVCTWTISSTPTNPIVNIYEVSSGKMVFAEIALGSGSVTVKMNSANNIAAGTYKAVIIG
jgi:hypothetical protein